MFLSRSGWIGKTGDKAVRTVGQAVSASPDPRTQNAPFPLLRPSLYLKQSLNPVSFYYNHIAKALLVPEKLEALALTLFISSFTP